MQTSPPIISHAGAWRLVGAMYAIALSLGWWLGFGYDGTDLNLMAGVALFSLAIAFLARRRGFARTATAIDASVVMLAGSVATAILTALFATSALPFQDAALARADAALFGSGWPAIHRWMETQPAPSALLGDAYATLGWQPFVVVALLAAAGRTDRIARLATGWIVALIVCAVTFPFVPALGPYVHFGLSPASSGLLGESAPGWHAPQVLMALRDGSLTTIGAAQLTGLVAFPSFHTAGAVLLGWAALALPRPIAAPFVLLNIAMVLSTPTVGSHYLVDTAAGLVLAMVAIRVSGRNQYARATANSTASTIASLALPPPNTPSASIARCP